MKHKLVCWGDYSIPVPTWANWMMMDECGLWWVSEFKPKSLNTIWVTGDEGGDCEVIVSDSMSITPPEPGPWHKQLYWIAD